MPQPMDDGHWDFDAGQLALDFANTAEWHAAAHPLEKLHSYEDLVGWSQQAELLDGGECQRLLTRARKNPREAAAVFKEALQLREDIYRIFSALASGKPPAQPLMARFNAMLGQLLAGARIEHTEGGFAWSWKGMEEGLDRMLGPILHSAADLLTSDDLQRIGECEDDRGCGYLFYDASRNHSRRWCSMESCGNRAKALRYYGRRKAGG